MAKILVADDNSNIQKMVALALKDQGVDVVAVGNGEAAVRKISDVRPDLVLADIFMPVRNGYEVCKFVKDNAGLAHIPVILLVGAFDPLDEQEAQRVGADGVLKKPFVPPDPLISMVKSSLARAGINIGAAPAASAPPPPPPPSLMGSPAKLAPVSSPRVAPAVAEEEFALPSGMSSRPAPLQIDAKSQPLAFGSLLDTPTLPDEDTVFTISSSQKQLPERDWGASTATEEEEPEEAEKTGSWRVSSLGDGVDDVPAGQRDWREAAFSGIGTDAAAGQHHPGGWAPTIDKHSLAISEEEAAVLERERAAISEPAPAQGAEDWKKAIAQVFPERPISGAESDAHKAEAPVAAALAGEPAKIEEPVKPEPKADVNSWMAGAVSQWESELPRVNDLSSSWETAAPQSTSVLEQQPSSATEAFLNSGLIGGTPEPEIPVHEPVEEVVPEAETPVAESKYAAEQMPSAVEHFAQVAEPEPEPEIAAKPFSEVETVLSPANQELLHQQAEQALAEQSVAVGKEPLAANHGEPASNTTAPPPDMDDIISKVLAKMNPEVLQAMTREILKPMVEALIKDELSKK